MQKVRRKTEIFLLFSTCSIKQQRLPKVYEKGKEFPKVWVGKCGGARYGSICTVSEDSAFMELPLGFTGSSLSSSPAMHLGVTFWLPATREVSVMTGGARVPQGFGEQGHGPISSAINPPLGRSDKG